MDHDPKYQALGGWLLFFFATSVLSLFIGIFQYFNLLSQGVPLYWVLLAFGVPALRVVVLCLIGSQKKAYFRWYVAEFIYSVLLVVAISVCYGVSFFVELISLSGPYVVWLLYFANSQRCREYFGQTLARPAPLPISPPVPPLPGIVQPPAQQAQAPLNHCINCGVMIPDGKTHCTACRQRLHLDAPAPAYAAPVPDEAAQARAQLRYCKYCGLEMGRDVMVCPSCGRRVRWFRRPTKTAILAACLVLSLAGNVILGVLFSRSSHVPTPQLSEANRAAIDLVNRYAQASGMTVPEYIDAAKASLEGASVGASYANTVYYTDKGLEYHADRNCPRLLDDGPYPIYSADGSSAPGLVKTPNAYKKACRECIS